jgi:hypothetical protein
MKPALILAQVLSAISLCWAQSPKPRARLAVGAQRQRNFQLPGSRLLARNNFLLARDPGPTARSFAGRSPRFVHTRASHHSMNFVTMNFVTVVSKLKRPLFVASEMSGFG